MGHAHAWLWRPRNGRALTGPLAPELSQALQVEASVRKFPTVRPRDAATLILLDHTAGATRVLLGRRHAAHKFMPGKFVFPGGRIEPSDRQMAIAGPLDGVVEAKLNARTQRPSPGFARALALAAIRETFEETGLAVGVTDCGAPPKPPEGTWARFAATGVFPTLDGLDFLARAITPPGRPRRFDTRFFVADAASIAHRAPDVIHAEAELVELVWTPLDEATELDLPLITRVVLSELAAATKAGMDRFRARPFYHSQHKRWLREEL
jgi:8-oxo-dGTP pyrophosphatase MutT (NUDIX family)